MGELKFKSGIYKITINDYYIYIGQSVDIEKRCRQHLNQLKQNKHCNKKLQNIFNKYPNTIKFEIIEECDVDKLDEREMFYIEQFKSYNTDHGLNLSIGGEHGNFKYTSRIEARIIQKEQTKQWYQAHKEKIKKQYNENKDIISKKTKRWRQTHKEHLKQQYFKNKEKIKQQLRKYYQIHKDARSEYSNDYYQSHKEIRKEYRRKWYQNNKEIFKQYNKQYNIQYAIKKGRLSRKERFEQKYKLSRRLTDREWQEWCELDNHNKNNANSFLSSLSNLKFEFNKIKTVKEKFEYRYNLSRPLTDEEWNNWLMVKYHCDYYAIKYLETLSNLKFRVPNRK